MNIKGFAGNSGITAVSEKFIVSEITTSGLVVNIGYNQVTWRTSSSGEAFLLFAGTWTVPALPFSSKFASMGRRFSASSPTAGGGGLWDYTIGNILNPNYGYLSSSMAISPGLLVV